MPLPRNIVRRDMILGLGAALVCAVLPASAQSVTEQVVDQLRRQGYADVTVRRTLLGRVRITADGPRGQREVILNPGTGAILRDYEDRNEDSSDRSGRDNDDDDDDNDDDDDDDDDDNDDDDDDNDGDDDDDD